MNEEQRKFQRLNLTRPLDGWFGDFAVRLTVVSAVGARIEHDEPIPESSRGLLRFYWRDQELEILSETVLGDDGHSGIRFLDDSDGLRRAIAESARELLRAQEANATGNRAANFIGDATLTAASGLHGHGYVTWVFHDGQWKGRPALLPEQPQDGFTISAHEPDEQVEVLRQTYERGDAEARRLTRLLAELSVAERR